MMKYKYLILFVFGLLIHACDDIIQIKIAPKTTKGATQKPEPPVFMY